MYRSLHQPLSPSLSLWGPFGASLLGSRGVSSGDSSAGQIMNVTRARARGGRQAIFGPFWALLAKGSLGHMYYYAGMYKGLINQYWFHKVPFMTNH